MQLLMTKIFIGIFLFLGFLYVAGDVEDPDLGWHLKVGKEMLVSGEVPHFDKYSWTMSGFEWVDHEWLTDVLLVLMDDYNLWFVAVFLFVIFAFAPFAIWIKRSDNFAHLLVVMLAASSLISFIGVRPQIISFFLFFVIFELLRKRKLFLLPLIFLIWANLHAGFFAGLIIFGLFVVSSTLERNNENPGPRLRGDDRKWGGDDRKSGNNGILIFIVSIAATFINPYGWKLYREIFTVILSSDTARYIAEWLPIFSKFNFVWILYLGIFFALALLFRKKYQPVYLLISAFFALAAIKSSRNWPMFLISSTPVLFLGIDFVKGEIKSTKIKKPFDAKMRMILRNIFIATFVFIAAFFCYELYKYDAMEFPEKATIFLNGKIKSGQWQDVKLLNTYGWGGYLIKNSADAKVFIDGRMSHWIDKDGNSAMKDYIKIFYSNDKSEWDEVFDRRDINTILIVSSSYGSIKAVDLKEWLLANGWQVIYDDKIAVILRKQ